MNFNQWRNYAGKGDVSKVTYICGDQDTLTELVLDDIKNILQVAVTDYVCLDASQSDSVWEMASQYPLDPDSNRLTVVRQAEKLTDWDQLSDWLASSRANPKNYLVFVSDLPDAPAVFSKGKRVSYAEHIELIRTKGKFIKCSQPNEEDLIKWCQSYGLTLDTAEFLATRTSGDVAEIYSVLKKLRAWDGPPNKKAIELFCQELALDSFADYLILQDKKSAWLAAKNIDTTDLSQLIARLDSRLDCMSDIYRCTIRRMYDVDIATTTGIKIFLIKKFKPVAKEYDSKKVKRSRQLIALIDGHLRNGARTGIVESLITLW